MKLQVRAERGSRMTSITPAKTREQPLTSKSKTLASLVMSEFADSRCHCFKRLSALGETFFQLKDHSWFANQFCHFLIAGSHAAMHA